MGKWGQLSSTGREGSEGTEVSKAYYVTNGKCDWEEVKEP